MIGEPQSSTLFPYTTLFRSQMVAKSRSASDLSNASTTATTSAGVPVTGGGPSLADDWRSEEHTSELQSRFDLVCRLLLEKKKRTHALRARRDRFADLVIGAR